jgi:hypothetical protein
MTVLPQPPTWLQNAQYSARRDRTILDLLYTEGVFDIGGGDLEVTQRAIGLNNSVDVAPGRAVIEGDDEAAQGSYLLVVEGVLNVPFGPAPLSDSRWDLLVLQVNDATAGSVRTPADVAELKIIVGVPGAVPVVPPVPITAIPLAQVLRTAGDIDIDNTMITDLRAPSTQAEYTTFSRFEVLTTAERNALASPIFVGRSIYNSDADRLETWDGVAWVGTGIFAVTTAQRNALTGLYPGYTVLNTDTGGIETYDGSNWITGSFFVVDTVGRDALVPYIGLTVYNTDALQLQTYDGSNWLGVGIFAVTTAERNALTPYTGLTVFNSTVSRIQVYDGAVWRDAGETFFAALTTAQRDGLTPFVGQTIFNTDVNQVQVWDGSAWGVIGVQVPAPDPVPLILALS